MSETEDLPPVIAVNWDAVEESIGHAVEPDLRRVIEHEGSTSGVALDRWGYAGESTTALFTAVRERARIIHPKRGPLDARYAPLQYMSGVIDVLRTLRGEDHRVGTIVKDGPDEAYLGGLADLYDVVKVFNEFGVKWREGQHPAVVCSNHGPDRLGDLSVHAGHTDWVVFDELDISDLPVKRAHILDHGDHYTAAFRHERYYPEEDPDTDTVATTITIEEHPQDRTRGGGR